MGAETGGSVSALGFGLFGDCFGVDVGEEVLEFGPFFFGSFHVVSFLASDESSDPSVHYLSAGFVAVVCAYFGGEVDEVVYAAFDGEAALSFGGEGVEAGEAVD